MAKQITDEPTSRRGTQDTGKVGYIHNQCIQQSISSYHHHPTFDSMAHPPPPQKKGLECPVHHAPIDAHQGTLAMHPYHPTTLPHGICAFLALSALPFLRPA